MPFNGALQVTRAVTRVGPSFSKNSFTPSVQLNTNWLVPAAEDALLHHAKLISRICARCCHAAS